MAMVIVFGITGSVVHAQNKDAWSLSCADKNKAETCLMSQTRHAIKNVAGKNQNVGQLFKMTVLYVTDNKTKKRQLNMTIQLPLGVDIRPGAVIQIDKNKEFSLPYLQCTRMGCDVSMVVDKKMLRSILSGNDLKVGYRAWGTNKISVITATLSGFTKIFRRLK